MKFGAYSFDDALILHFTSHSVAERAFQRTGLERPANSLVLSVAPVLEKLPIGGDARGGNALELCHTLIPRLRRSSWTLRRVSRPMGRRPLVRRSPWQQRGRREVVAIRVESEPQIITCWLIFGTKDARRLDSHDSVSRRQDVNAPPQAQCGSDEHVAVAELPRTTHGLLPLFERAVFKPCRVRAESLPQIRERDRVLVARCHPRPIT